MQVETPPVETPIETNEAYITPVATAKEPAVLSSVTRAIFVDTLKDFFGGIAGFIMRYLKHFASCFVYFWSPSIRKAPFDKKDFKENSQHAFEFTIIILAGLLFMIKVDWIPEPPNNMADLYNNELTEKFVDVYLFFVFAVSYVLFAVLTVLLGRFFRSVFRLKISRKESDILMVYMNNAFFSFTAIIALFIRSVASVATHDEDSIAAVLLSIIIPIIFIAALVWCIRFSMLHQVKFLKAFTLSIFAVTVFGLFHTFSSFIICSIVLNI